MSSIDNRVVKMEFDNKQFESGVSTTMSTLDKFKEKLKFKNETKSIENLQSVADKTNFNPLLSAVETISSRFTTLGVIGVTALQNITNAAIATGSRMLSALTIDPIKSGLSEYETQINSVQTILSNTKSKGTTIDQVNAALDELNAYADKTIYNFTEMTRNIGTFTAAGVGLDDSVQAIKGIANLAAMSGSTSAQASQAMYQLSQALAAGRISLMDWNSVVNAGMGGEVFQNALKRTAENMGTNVDAIIEKYGSFRESLTEGGWLTTDVLTQTLAQFAGAYDKAALMEQGYTEQQANDILQLAQTAEDAATKVTTFTKLVDTLGEALQSGWTQSWETVIGDFEEARNLWTEVSNVLGNYINESANARNEMLKGWKDMGGRQELIDGIAQAFNNLVEIASAVHDAFVDIFPPITSEQLYNLTKGFNDLMKDMKPSPELLDQIGRIAKGVFSIFDSLGRIIGAVASAIGGFLGSDGVTGFINSLLEGAASLGDFFTELNKGLKTGNALDVFKSVLNGVLQTVSDFIGIISGGVGSIGDVFGKIADGIGTFVDSVSGPFKKAIEWIRDNVDLGTIFGAVGAYGAIAGLKQLKDIASTIKDFIDSLRGGEGTKSTQTIKDNITELLDGVKESFESFVSGVKVGSLFAIAASIGILTAALAKLSEIPAPAVVGSLTAIGIMMGELVGTLTILSSVLKKFDTKGLMKAGASMVLIASAVNILADAVEKLADLDTGKLAQGLVGVGVGLGELVAAIKVMGKSNVSLKTSVAIIAVAKACQMLSEAVDSFSGMNWDEIGRGLTGMGGALAEVTAATAILGKFGGGRSVLGSVGILITVRALKDLGEILDEVSKFSWDDIGKGLSVMATALIELVAALGILSKIGGFSSILGGTALVIAVQSLKPIADALNQISGLSWEEIGKGLTGMGGALGELSTISGIFGKTAGFSGLLGATSLVVAVQSLEPIADALEQIGGLSWEEIGKGLSGMGGALTEMAVISGLLGSLAGLSSLVGAGTILLGVQALQPIADALQQLGSMTWEEIGRGLVAMGGALTEVGVISGVLGTLAGPMALLGSGSLLLGVQGLNDLADALSKFGSMDWDSIGRGLTAMGAAMGETALGGLLNTLSGFGAESIATIAAPLGTLADSMKKWAGVEVPEGLGAKIGELAGGIMQFTFGGFGAGAISTVAEPLGTLATSIKKWATVEVPEGMQEKLQGLARGVEAFTFSGMGGEAIATVAEPLGNLATAVGKWSGVTIPDGMQEKLEGLANGVNAFTLSFVAGFGIDSIIEPLGNLAGAVKKWNGVTIPEGIGPNLEGLAQGLNAFVGFNSEGTDFSSISTAITSIVTALQGATAVDFSGFTASINSFVSAISLVPAKVQELNTSLSTLGTTVSTSFATALLTGIAAASNGAVSAISSMFASISSVMLSNITTISAAMVAGGLLWMVSLASGISSGESGVTTAASGVMQSAASACSGYAGLFYNAGVDAMAGLASGIRQGGSAAITAAASVATRALQSAQSALAIHSPSRKFMEVGRYSDEGLALGFERFGKLVSTAAENVSKDALDATEKGFNHKSLKAMVNPVINSDNLGIFGSGASLSANVKADGLNSDILTLSQMMSSNEAAMLRGNKQIADSVTSLKEDVTKLGESIEKMQWGFYVDGKDLAKASAKSMDRQLQILSRRRKL